MSEKRKLRMWPMHVRDDGPTVTLCASTTCPWCGADVGVEVAPGGVVLNKHIDAQRRSREPEDKPCAYLKRFALVEGWGET